MSEDTGQDVWHERGQRRHAVWMTAALIAGVWAIALAIVALAWEVAR